MKKRGLTWPDRLCALYLVVFLLDGWWHRRLGMDLLWIAAGVPLGVAWAIGKRRWRKVKT